MHGSAFLSRSGWTMWLALLVLVAGGPVATAAPDPPPAVPDQRLPMAGDEADKLGFVPNWYQNLELPRSQHVAEATRLGDLILIREQPRPMVTAVEVSNGQIRWRREIGEPDETFYAPVRLEDRVFFATPLRVRELSARTGEVTKRGKLSFFAQTPPLLIGKAMVFGGSDGRIFAYHVDRRLRVWKRALPQRLITPLVQQGNYFFVTDAAGHYAVYNGATANQLWRRQVFEEIRAKPAMDGDTVYVPTMGRTLYAVDRRSGRERWTFHAEQALDKPVYRVGRHLFLPLGKETLLALDHETGQERWRLDESALIPLTTVNEQVIFYGEDQLTLMQEQDGVAIADAQSDPLHTVLTGPNQSLLLVTPDGRLQRLNLGG